MELQWKYDGRKWPETATIYMCTMTCIPCIYTDSSDATNKDVTSSENAQ